MIPARVIERKRDGESLDEETLGAFLEGYLAGHVHEYQMSAFLMAVLFRGLDGRELDILVQRMVDSGEVLDLSALGPARVDKHSTGGVGDKVSLVIAPLAAELGLYVPMMGGRGLGHTGGTLDKIESIPGFRTDLTLSEFKSVLETVGCAIIGQTDEIAPLDRRLYALRDVTATVPSIPLIAASIMSKKLAEGLTGLVLDVKVGKGAFIPEEERALELARTMTGIGMGRGVPTVALLTAMDRPLGRTVGNALEVSEALACLRSEGPPDLREIVLALAAEMAVVGGLAAESGKGRRLAEAALDGGGPLVRFGRLVAAQGGDESVVDDASVLPRAPETSLFRAPRGGFLRRVDPVCLGRALIELGGGRSRLGQRIDPAVGFRLEAEPGAELGEGEVLAQVHARDARGLALGMAALEEAIEVGEKPPSPLRPLVSHRVNASEVLRLT